jgi:hypothetical protein
VREGGGCARPHELPDIYQVWGWREESRKTDEWTLTSEKLDLRSVKRARVLHCIDGGGNHVLSASANDHVPNFTLVT